MFAETITEGGTLIYFRDDPEVAGIAESARPDITRIPYTIHGYFSNKTGFYCATHNRIVPLKIFGGHNMQNLSAAKEACLIAGIDEDQFYNAVQTFEGTSKRLQKLHENDNGIVFLDFAHAPSKVKATLDAIAEYYPGRNIIACLELHTYSSLNLDFLPLYRGTLEKACTAFVYFNPHTVELKKLKMLSEESVARAFGGTNLTVFNDSSALINELKNLRMSKPVYLLMSSGDFNGTVLQSLAVDLLANKNGK
jgi:UDP-N-acetylmuramate: L-alanyl-gamma-D-glutamyl-meso-diaminopimelate ligase